MSDLFLLPGAMGRRNWTRNLAKGLEARLIANATTRLKKQPLAKATATGRDLFQRYGPKSAMHKDVVANLAVLYPDATTDQLESKAVRTWGWLGVTVAEMVHARDLTVEAESIAHFEISDEVDEILRGFGRPAVLASAHVGPWLLCNLITTRHSFPLTTTMPHSSNTGLDQLVQETLRSLPVEKVTMDEGYKPLSAEIKQGHKVFLTVDGWNDEGHNVPMFDARMRLDPTAAHLAVRHHCPLIPIHALRLPEGQYRVIAKRALWPDESIESETERAQLLTRAFAVEFEQWIRKMPGQWLCLTPRWADETIWSALTRVAERTQLPPDQAPRMSDEDLDKTLTQQVPPRERLKL